MFLFLSTQVLIVIWYVNTNTNTLIIIIILIEHNVVKNPNWPEADQLAAQAWPKIWSRNRDRS